MRWPFSLSLQIELKKVRWKENSSASVALPDGFLPLESCALGPLTILDRWYVCMRVFVCVCIEFRQLCSNDEERKSDGEREEEEEEKDEREMVERQSNVVCVYAHSCSEFIVT